MTWLLHLALASLSLCLSQGFNITISDPAGLEPAEIEALLANNTQLFPIDIMTPAKRSFQFSFADLKELFKNKTAQAVNSQLFNLDLMETSFIIPGRGRSMARERSTSDCGCGGSPATGRIVGGGEVTPMHSRPYQVYLQSCSSSGCAMCGATLLNKRYVLTAMHCVTDATNLVVALGEHNIRQSIESHSVQSIKVASVIKRQDYSESDVNNDIAILKLERVGSNLLAVCCVATLTTVGG